MTYLPFIQTQDSPPSQKKRWSQEEESIILQQSQIVGTNWNLIAEQLPGRSTNTIMHRYYTKILMEPINGLLVKMDLIHQLACINFLMLIHLVVHQLLFLNQIHS